MKSFLSGSLLIVSSHLDLSHKSIQCLDIPAVSLAAMHLASSVHTLLCCRSRGFTTAEIISSRPTCHLNPAGCALHHFTGHCLGARRIYLNILWSLFIFFILCTNLHSVVSQSLLISRRQCDTRWCVMCCVYLKQQFTALQRGPIVAGKYCKTNLKQKLWQNIFIVLKSPQNCAK